MKDKLKETISSHFSYRTIHLILKFIVRIFSYLMAGVLYIFMSKLLSNIVENSHEVSLFISILTLILLFLPIQDSLEEGAKKSLLSEYIIDDESSTKITYRRFDFFSFIYNVFPDMIKLGGSESGRLVLFGKNEPIIYTYNPKSKHNKVKSTNYLINDNFKKYLLDKKEGIALSQCLSKTELSSYFESLKSNFILPFVTKEKLLGFISFEKEVDTDSEEFSSLKSLASKATLAIYNHNLSTILADSHKYKREVEIADKIQNFIFKKYLPDIPNYEFSVVNENKSIIMEYFKGENQNFFVFVTLGSRGSDLVLSYLLGVLYSYSFHKKRYSTKFIHDLILNTTKNVDWEKPPEILFCKLRDDGFSFELHCTQFKISIENDPSKSIQKLDARNTLNINEQEVFVIYKNKTILSMKRLEK